MLGGGGGVLSSQKVRSCASECLIRLNFPPINNKGHKDCDRITRRWSYFNLVVESSLRALSSLSNTLYCNGEHNVQKMSRTLNFIVNDDGIFFSI